MSAATIVREGERARARTHARAYLRGYHAVGLTPRSFYKDSQQQHTHPFTHTHIYTP